MVSTVCTRKNGMVLHQPHRPDLIESKCFMCDILSTGLTIIWNLDLILQALLCQNWNWNTTKGILCASRYRKWYNVDQLYTMPRVPQERLSRGILFLISFYLYFYCISKWCSSLELVMLYTFSCFYQFIKMSHLLSKCTLAYSRKTWRIIYGPLWMWMLTAFDLPYF